ncbi:MAG: type II toxin-antitoxin system HicA family toxin [Candidatus Rokubacteria bacterium]|nr:type II toxin-antitoxin system HicA family toxin [Candidatus Rokubacteria bacterium]
MTYAELTRALRALGCILKRQAKGSHEIWHCPRTNRSATIPRHTGDLPPGTLRAILRGLGLTREDLDSI